MNDYGIKVVNAGKDINSTDVRDIILSSEYTMFKYHSSGTITLTINTGDNNVYGTISHNLGYVPAFICYQSSIGDPYGYQSIVPAQSYYQSQYQDSDAKMGTANLVVGYHYLNTPFGQISFTVDQIYHELDTGEVNVLMGNVGGSGYSSAVRFPTVNISKNEAIISASIEFFHQLGGPTNSNTKYRLYGIDEDNVGDVDTGKTKTTAYTEGEQAKFTNWSNFSVNVKTQVEEITTRSGWSSGNNMGFIINDNSSPEGAYVAGDNSSYAILTVGLSGSISITYRAIIFKDKIV